jgi:hypothetical protein
MGNIGRKGCVPVAVAIIDPELRNALHPGGNVLAVEWSLPAGSPRPERPKTFDAGLFTWDEL